MTDVREAARTHDEKRCGVLVPHPAILNQHRASMIDQCESAERTANTGQVRARKGKKKVYLRSIQ